MGKFSLLALILRWPLLLNTPLLIFLGKVWMIFPTWIIRVGIRIFLLDVIYLPYSWYMASKYIAKWEPHKFQPTSCARWTWATCWVPLFNALSILSTSSPTVSSNFIFWMACFKSMTYYGLLVHLLYNSRCSLAAMASINFLILVVVVKFSEP